MPGNHAAARNVTFHRTAAAAQAAGYRACRRCLPDATPGSPDWDVAADVAGRAMRLIADGVVERDGVEGLAARVGYTSRHLTRLLGQELGAGPLALARARRAQMARTLIETTSMPFADVAFAAGFSSIRQFNDTVRAVYAASPSQLRGRAPRTHRTGAVELRLPVRAPFAGDDLLVFLAAHLVPGVECSGPGWYERTLALPHGPGRVRLTMPSDAGGPAVSPGSPERTATGTAFVGCRLELTDLRDLGAAVERCRRLLDADCDPNAVDESLAGDPRLAPLVRRRPGLRVPGSVDGAELAVRAVIGQQISVAGAIALGAKLVSRYGEWMPVEPLPEESQATPADAHDPDARPGRLFPRPEVLAEVDPAELPMPRARGRALVRLCRAIGDGEVALDRSGDRAEVRARLLALPGIGPWTADYVALRALGDPDVFLPTDAGVRRALARRGEETGDQADLQSLGRTWRPWRSYALVHLWSTLDLAPARTRVAAPSSDATSTTMGTSTTLGRTTTLTTRTTQEARR